MNKYPADERDGKNDAGCERRKEKDDFSCLWERPMVEKRRVVFVGAYTEANERGEKDGQLSCRKQRMGDDG